MSSTDSWSVLSQALSSGPQAAVPRLILASGSRVRAILLEQAGIQAAVRPADVDEDAIKLAAQEEGAGPGETALRLAEQKAGQIMHPDALVIGADQLLVCEGRWFDKPADLAAARDHLIALRGRSHELHTAVAVYRGGQLVWSHVATPRMTMRAISDAALEEYLALEGERLLSSVGAYRLEGPGIQLFDHIEGEHGAILGLPMLPLLKFLREHGVLRT